MPISRCFGRLAPHPGFVGLGVLGWGPAAGTTKAAEPCTSILPPPRDNWGMPGTLQQVARSLHAEHSRRRQRDAANMVKGMGVAQSRCPFTVQAELSLGFAGGGTTGPCLPACQRAMPTTMPYPDVLLSTTKRQMHSCRQGFRRRAAAELGLLLGIPPPPTSSGVGRALRFQALADLGFL